MSCTRSRSGSAPHEPLTAIITRITNLCEVTETLVTNTEHHEQCILNHLHRFTTWSTAIGASNCSPRSLEDRLREFSAWLPHDTLEMLQSLERSLITLNVYLFTVQQGDLACLDDRESLGSIVRRVKASIIHTVEDLYRVRDAVVGCDKGEPSTFNNTDSERSVSQPHDV